jgi:hypothetical protein
MTQSTQNALKRKAAAWAGQLTRLAKSYAPDHVRPAISSHVEEREGQFLIRITADRGIAPDARAQEYGSGLRAKRGPKVKYPILPKTKKMLAFHWEVANANPEYFDFLPDGRVMLRAVMHPGIQAANAGKGYIAPAVRELKKRGKKELTEEIRLAILDDIRRSFGRKR